MLIVLIAAPASSQNREMLQLQKDMIDVMQIVKQLQTTLDRDNAVMKGLIERTTDQVNTLTTSIQKITQSLDGLKVQNETAVRDLRTTLTTLNATVKELQGDLSSARAQITSVS